jgi:hypothetical protein
VVIVTGTGWDTNPNPAPGAPLVVNRQPNNLCSGGCEADWSSPFIDDNGFGLCSTSATAGSTGLFAVRCAHNYSYTGNTCTASESYPDSEAEFNPEPPPCNGVFTSVGGVNVCVPVAGSGAASTPVAPDFDGAQMVPRITPEDIYAPGANDGGRGGTFPGGGSGVWDDDGGLHRGNEGSTVSIGGGGAFAGSFSGVVDIDESGTPDGSAEVASAESAFGAAGDALVDALEDTGGDGAVDEFGWGFAWEFPSGSCASFSFGLGSEVTVWDWCGTLGRIRSLWGWMLGLLSALYIWRLLVRSVGE